MNKEELLGEVEDLLRNTPPRATIFHHTEENFSWFGRARSVVTAFDSILGIGFSLSAENLQGPFAGLRDSAFSKIMQILHQVRSDLRMQTTGPMSIAIGKGMVYDYFDEIRKGIESATSDILFIDSYLNADFVSQYLGHVKEGVSIRLLGSEQYLKSLIPAAEAFSMQNNLELELRTSPNLHDRYMFIDRNQCYQSGASFKDGGKKSPTTLTQITDAFSAVFETYETLWLNGSIQLQIKKGN